MIHLNRVRISSIKDIISITLDLKVFENKRHLGNFCLKHYCLTSFSWRPYVAIYWALIFPVLHWGHPGVKLIVWFETTCPLIRRARLRSRWLKYIELVCLWFVSYIGSFPYPLLRFRNRWYGEDKVPQIIYDILNYDYNTTKSKKNQKTFIRWYHNSGHGAGIMLWHWDVTMRLRSFAVLRYNGTRYSQVHASISADQ